MDTVTPQNGQLHSNGSTMKVGLLNQAETTHWLTKRLTRKITEWLNSQQQQFISQGNHSVNWSVKHTKSINPFISLSLTLLVLVNQPASHSVCQSLFLLVCLCVGASLFLSYKLISDNRSFLATTKSPSLITESHQGTQGWKIFIAVFIPVLVVGLVVAVAIWMKKRTHRSLVAYIKHYEKDADDTFPLET